MEILITVIQDSEAMTSPLLTAPGKRLGMIKIQTNFTASATAQNNTTHPIVKRTIAFDPATAISLSFLWLFMILDLNTSAFESRLPTFGPSAYYRCQL
jgi:hypothetical protein